MLTPCKKVPCKSEWCRSNKRCWLYENYKPATHKDPFDWVDGKYVPTKKTKKYIASDKNLKHVTKRGRPRHVKYPKYIFDSKETECFYCSKEINKATRTRDHVFPRIKGGTLCDGNKVWSCQECNSYKSNYTVLEFRDILNKMMEREKYANKSEYLKGILVKVEFMITKLYP